MNVFDLTTYPLPESIRSRLQRADISAALLERVGRDAPDVIDLPKDQFKTVDMIVSTITNGRVRAHSVRWRGREITAEAA